MVEYSEFRGWILATQSSVATTRQSAETAYIEFRRTNINLTCRYLLQGICEGESDGERMQCSILLRTTFRNMSTPGSEGDTAWGMTHEDTRTMIKSTLLDRLTKESNDAVCRSICETAASLAGSLLQKNQWPELKTFVIQMIQQDHAKFIKYGLRILSDVADILLTELSQVPEQTYLLLDRTIRHEDPDVRCETLEVIAVLVDCNDRGLSRTLSELMPMVTATLRQSVATNHSGTAAVLESLIRIAEVNSNFFKRDIKNLMETVLLIAKTETTDQGWRQLALEVALTAVEERPSMMLRLEPFLRDLTMVLYGIVSEIRNEDFQEWLDSTEESRANDNISEYGEEGLDRLCRVYEENATIMGYHAEAITHATSCPEWYYQVTGLFGIAQICEYLHQGVMDEVIDSFVRIILVKLQDQDCRVRYAACQALGQLSLDHTPDIQEMYHSDVLPILVQVMGDCHPRVQSHAASAFVNFAEELEAATLAPYADHLMNLFYTMCTASQSTLVRQQAITCVAVMAGVLEADFAKYYATMLPILTTAIQKCVGVEERTCRGKAIECMSIIALSLGKENIGNQVHEMMQLILPIWQELNHQDEIVHEYAQEAISRMCRTLKTDVRAYLPMIMPKLFGILNERPTSIADVDSVDEKDMTVLMVADQYIGLRTSLIEAQEQAVDLLGTLVEVLQELYDEHVPATIHVVLPLTQYVLSDSLKHRALTLMSELIRVAREAATKGNTSPDLVIHTVRDLVERLLKNLDSDYQKSLKLDMDLDTMLSEAAGLKQCLMEGGSIALDATYIQNLVIYIFKLLTQATERQEERRQTKQAPDIEEDELNTLKDDADSEQALRTTLASILGVVMRQHPAAFIQSCANQTLHFVTHVLSSTSCDDDKAIALYICDDLIEELGANGVPLWPRYMPIFIEFISSDAPMLRQAVFYGVMHAAKQEAFSYYADPVARQLIACIQKYGNQSKKSIEVSTDNAIAALGNILKYHAKSLPQAGDMLKLWLYALPLKQDDDEAQHVHADLIQYIEQNNPVICPPDNSNLFQIVKIFSSIYKSILSNQDLDEKMCAIIANVGQERCQAFFDKLKPKQQKKLTRMFQDRVEAKAA